MTATPIMTIRTTAMTMTTIKEKPPLKLRHELKYRISLRDDRILASRLGKLFPRDKNAGKEGSYRITSLYFDTPSDTALRQKLEGVDRREKFRLRYYGEDLSFIRLEKKFKMNGLCGKHSASTAPGSQGSRFGISWRGDRRPCWMEGSPC